VDNPPARSPVLLKTRFDPMAPIRRRLRTRMPWDSCPRSARQESDGALRCLKCCAAR